MAVPDAMIGNSPGFPSMVPSVAKGGATLDRISSGRNRHAVAAHVNNHSPARRKNEHAHVYRRNISQSRIANDVKNFQIIRQTLWGDGRWGILDVAHPIR